MNDSELEPLPVRAPLAEMEEEIGRPEHTEAHARVRTVVERHYDFVWRTLQYLGLSEANAEDAGQQVMCVLARRIGEIEPGAETSFLFSTTMRIASEWRRSARRRPPASDVVDLEALVDATPAPDELLEQRRARELLGQVLDAIPDELRVVFVLFELEEMTVPAIAELVGIPVGTVASRLRRARSEFQAAVARMRATARRRGGL
jgi:RNA polymerase sigma-70 factor (ECF subfamily)